MSPHTNTACSTQYTIPSLHNVKSQRGVIKQTIQYRSSAVCGWWVIVARKLGNLEKSVGFFIYTILLKLLSHGVIYRLYDDDGKVLLSSWL